ncbi:hypothetical protein IQ06DRAFT_304600 [Phaeosphaeriaceae sp. SRC1lsM3a]|nr:hypothetical protein IQ06DRAFT_304600 [Stagonospora sp. SRC1lsM3a]
MFLDTLSAELRIQIYGIIITRTIVIKDHTRQEASQSYRGLIFLCKQVLTEYKCEAEKLFMPIDSLIQQLWTFEHPILIFLPSKLSYPTHMQISIPAEVFQSDPSTFPHSHFQLITSILVAMRTRVTFSIHKASTSLWKDQYRAYLVELCNQLCSNVASKKHGFRPSCYCPLLWASSMWIKKGFQLRQTDNPPRINCDYVALHMKRGVVVFDTYMSKEN